VIEANPGAKGNRFDAIAIQIQRQGRNNLLEDVFSPILSVDNILSSSLSLTF
jgi:hypothetical protein